MTQTTATSVVLKRSMLIAFSLPSYVGAAFIASVVASHSLQGSQPPGPQNPGPLIMALGLLVVAATYVGIFAWIAGPVGAAMAMAFLLWDCWRSRSLRQHGVVLTLFVFGGPVLWLFSVPYFFESLKW